MKNVSQPKHSKALSIVVLESGQKARRVSSKKIRFPRIGHEIQFDIDALDTYDYAGWKNIHYDLLLVSAAIEFADCKHKHGISQWARNFKVKIPVHEVVIWQQKDVQDRLCEVARHLTGDDWEFNFIQRQGDPEGKNRQKCLPLKYNKKIVIAYSDGIDSVCVSALCEKSDEVLRVRVTKNQSMRKKDERPFDQIPFDIPGKNVETSVRSRGFKFAAITAVAAHISGAEKIVVPESGQGAFGPVLITLHNTYADYRNYPTYFRKMEKFIKAVLGHQVSYDQPRLWHTKGQTIKDFRSLQRSDRSYNDLITTRSCWQMRWNVFIGGKRQQCGLCPACILRRMSMHAAGLEEPVENIYFFPDLTAEHYSDAMLKDNNVESHESIINYGIIGVRHFQRLANMAKLPDEELSAYALELAEATDISKEKALNKLRTLLQNHAQEWDDFLRIQGEKTFLRRWMKGC